MNTAYPLIRKHSRRITRVLAKFNINNCKENTTIANNFVIRLFRLKRIILFRKFDPILKNVISNISCSLENY